MLPLLLIALLLLSQFAIATHDRRKRKAKVETTADSVALDSLTPTFRHEMFPEYKATRDKTPEDLHAQIPRIEEILKAMGIATLRKNGYEADDIIATYAKKCEEDGSACRIITGDKDLLQLVSENVKVIRYGKDDYTELDRDGVFAEWGVWPEQILDYLALCGDSADNIPGVKGIGPKGAVNLLQAYGNIDEIYANIEAIKGANKTKLEVGKDACIMSRKLAELCTKVPLEEHLETFSTAALNYKAPVPLLKKEGIKSAVKWLEGKVPAAEEGSLFAQPAHNPIRGTYKTITDLNQLDALLEEVKQAGIYAFDLDTANPDIVTDQPVGFSISTKAESGYYVPVSAQEQVCIPEEIIKNKLRQILENPTLKLVGYNIKFGYQVLCKWGIKPQGIWFDTMVAAWLVDTHITNYSIGYLTDHYFGYNYTESPSAEKADIILRLYEHLMPMVEVGSKDLFFNVEMPLVTILGDMELEGIRIDKHVLERYAVELNAKLGEIEKSIYKECGREFNVNSTQQLQEVLFTDRKLKPVKKTKTGYTFAGWQVE